MTSSSALNGDFIVPLREALDEQRVGGKARNLARLMDAGHPVPDGFVVTREALATFIAEADLQPSIESLRSRLDVRSPMGIRCAGETIAALVGESTIPEGLDAALADALTGLGDGPVIVRSSGVGEDSADASFAGQLDSIPDVVGFGLARRALLRVWASQWSPRALSYQLSRRVSLLGMGVIVQRQIPSAVSGVLFTRAPGRSRRMLIEYCSGSGDTLVSGRENPGRLLVTMDGRERTIEASLEGQPDAESLLTDRLIFRLARVGREIAELFGSPQDIEWTIEADGTLWILQTRPITVCEPVAAPAERQNVHWSNANVNENFPRPISPLLYSIASTGYYHYFRNLGRAFGISRRRLRAMEYPLRHIIGVHASRMYYNLSSIHGVLRSAPFGELLTSSFNQFVGSGDTSTARRHHSCRPVPDAGAGLGARGHRGQDDLAVPLPYQTRVTVRADGVAVCLANHTRSSQTGVSRGAARTLQRFHRHQEQPMEGRGACRCGSHGLLRDPSAASGPNGPCSRSAIAAQQPAQGPSGPGQRNTSGQTVGTVAARSSGRAPPRHVPQSQASRRPRSDSHAR